MDTSRLTEAQRRALACMVGQRWVTPSAIGYAMIFCAVKHPDKKPQRNFFYSNREEWGVFVTNAPKPGLTFHDAPDYTTSVDAALTLVPEGWAIEHMGDDFTIGMSEPVKVFGFTVDLTNGVREVQGQAVVRALAIVAAALRARETP